MPDKNAALEITPLVRPGPTFGLLSAAEVVTLAPTNPEMNDETGADASRIPLNENESGDRWLLGTKEWPYFCAPAAAAVGVPLQANPSIPSRTGTGLPAAQFTYPVMYTAGIKGSTFDWNASNYADRLQRIFAAYESSLVEHEFWAGTAAKAGAGIGYPQDQFLAQNTTCVNMTPGGAVSAVQANALVQEALSVIAGVSASSDPCGGGSPAMWHVPRMALPALWHSNLLRRDGNKYFTLTDDVVVPGAGYTGVGPGGEAATATTVWTYVTTPVRIFRDAVTIVPDTFAQATDRTTNDFTFFVQRNVLVHWDRCCHFGIRVQTDS